MYHHDKRSKKTKGLENNLLHEHSLFLKFMQFSLKPKNPNLSSNTQRGD